ncbi:MAG: type I restriction-modification system subunit M [Actinomycetota bacterium]|nr:type I restriction-modification system subunit M [Actinomycetota bacterium]
MRNHAAFIWSVADLLRGDYKRSEYGRVVLPLTVLRRLDGVLAPTKERVLKRAEALPGRLDPILNSVTGVQFNNTSELDLRKVLDDPSNAADQLRGYVAGFSENVREVFDKFDLDTQITRLDSSNLLYLVLGKFVDMDLGPENVSNTEMGYIYEELVRKFSELSNETAGEHFTPREVVELMVNLLFIEDDDLLSKPGTVKTMLDPACGTGGMLSVSEQYLNSRNPDAVLEVYGQELNAETYAVCRSDMLLKDPENIAHIVHGNSFSHDGHGSGFDYLLANPPFGVEWKKIKDAVEDENRRLGFAGRFGAGLPRINDGSFLFLQHMISKMKPVEEGGSRVAIVFNGSPLFTGAAGSGESEIRRWILENDWLEAVVALPDQLFYNTGISTYFWIVTNRKSHERQGKVQLVDARASWEKMRKSLGEKRKRISDDGIADIVKLYGDLEENDRVKILPNESFGAMRITVERPLRLRWEVTEETLAAIAADRKLSKLDDATREGLQAGLAEYPGLSGTDREALAVKLAPVFAEFGLTRTQESAVWDSLAVRDPEAPVITDRKGQPLPDPELRDHENVPLPEKKVVYEADVAARLESVEYRTAIRDYMEKEVLPYVPDAWVDYDKTKIGYEVPLTRHFYVYKPPRPLEEIDAEIKALEREIQELLAEVTE